MERTLILDTNQKIGQEVVIQGRLETRRDHGKIVFLDITDRSAVIQVVLTAELAKDLGIGDVVTIAGLIKSRPEKLINPKIATGTVEMEARKVEILAGSEPYPFDLGKPDLDVSLPTLLDYRGLTLRHPKVQAIFRVQAVIIDAFRRVLQEKGFLEFQAPGIIPAIPEGGTAVFEVKYFENKAFLSQSPQLYKSLLVSAFERVFSVNQIYRAEPSVTTRHLTEATSLDAEFGYIKDWTEVRDLAELVITFILDEVAKRNRAELAMFGATIPKVTHPIPSIKLREAQQIIYQRTGRDHRTEKDPDPDDERELCRWAEEKFGSELVFISHYPTKTRPFYTYPDEENPEFNQGFDLIGRGVEWLTGGRRINDYKTLVEHAAAWGVDPQKIDLYLQGFRYGMPPLGGFAFGAERITMLILGLANIREAAMFPRDMERVDNRLSDHSGTEHENEDRGEAVFGQIKLLLDKHKADYKTYEHEPVYTSEQAAKARGTKLAQGAKALVMYADEKPIMAVLPADRNIDTEQFKIKFKFKRLRMATKVEVRQLTGIEVGAVPPFGNLFGLPLYVDKALGDNQEIAFNAGLHTKSVKIKHRDFVALTRPTTGDFSVKK
jgi:nondiscriminating aspartyl-tRNA synthetase